MKKLIVLCAFALSVAGCDEKKADKATVTDTAPLATREQPAGATGTPGATGTTGTAGAAGATGTAPQGGVTYTFGPENSKIEFKGAKLTGSHLGGFKQFTGNIQVNGTTAETAAVNLTIQTDSIYSDNEKLTGHLKSPDFFDVQKFPTATFTSTKIAPGEAGKYVVTGDLNMHGVTKQISFPATIAIADGKATGKAEFTINRKDFGIVYPGMPDDLIKDDVTIMLDVNAAQGGSGSAGGPIGSAGGPTGTGTTDTAGAAGATGTTGAAGTTK